MHGEFWEFDLRALSAQKQWKEQAGRGRTCFSRAISFTRILYQEIGPQCGDHSQAKKRRRSSMPPEI
jgi:hypothetical protein